jgi:DNA-binding transcriptional regulator YhcF (GntR family)
LRFWITKNSELSIREQLVRQVVLAILSEDLPAGHKLPSIRALARRCQVHSNTVSAAYHQLLEDGWLELRRGSGLYVRFPQPSETDGSRLDALLTRLLRESRIQGYAPEDVLQRLAHMVQPRLCVRIAIVEPDPGMREILQAELAQHLRVPIEAIGLPDHSTIPVPDACLAAALPGRAAMVRERLPPGASFLALRLRSVRGSLETETMPGPNAIVSVVSRSPEFRQFARAMLISVGLAPECLCDVDTALEGWQERVRAGTLAIADVVAARNLPAGSPGKIFCVIADTSIAEIKQILRE